MSSIQSRSVIEQVYRLNKIIQIRKDLEKKEKEAKEALKIVMGSLDVNALVVGSYVLVIKDRVRTELNKKLVKELLEEKYEDCLVKSSYQTFEITKA